MLGAAEGLFEKPFLQILSAQGWNRPLRKLVHAIVVRDEDLEIKRPR